MSKEVQQFVELVQQATAVLKPKVYYLYCDACGGKTAHTLANVSSRWEYYACRVCGCRKSYKVK